MTEKKLSLGFSPCPNDTFIFNDFVHGLARDKGLNFEQPILADVETLNEWAMLAKLDVSKVSFHALGHILEDYILLRTGGALGRGCGPLLIASEVIDPRDLRNKKVAIPGQYTTAAMLLKLFAPECTNLVPMRFDKIIPAINGNEVAAGVVIHESRFTYHQAGLVELQDLGAWWEEISGSPIPLGGIVARRSLGEKTIKLISRTIRESVENAFANPEKSRAYVSCNAHELDDRVVQSHINLYVNDFSVDFGNDGLAAIKKFLDMGIESGVFSKNEFDPDNLIET